MKTIDIISPNYSPTGDSTLLRTRLNKFTVVCVVHFELFSISFHDQKVLLLRHKVHVLNLCVMLFLVFDWRG